MFKRAPRCGSAVEHVDDDTANDAHDDDDDDNDDESIDDDTANDDHDEISETTASEAALGLGMHFLRFPYVFLVFTVLACRVFLFMSCMASFRFCSFESSLRFL